MNSKFDISDRDQLNISALKWLYEMEALDSPVLQQNLMENVMFAHPGINDCKIFVTPAFTHQKGILIWVKLGFFTDLFSRQEVHTMISNVIQTLLPSYKVRVTNNLDILEMAANKVKELYEEPKQTEDESGISPVHDNNPDSDDAVPPCNESGKSGDGLSKTSNILSDQAEHAEDESSESFKSKQSDLQSDKET